MAKRTAEIIDHPLRMPEPPILQDTELAKGLARMRHLSRGGYSGVTPTFYEPELSGEHAALLAALLRWQATKGDGAYAAAVARSLVGSFPGARVDAESYASGLAAIVEDDRVSADIVRAVCRKARAERRSLPPLADLREEMLSEVEHRSSLLARLKDSPANWLAERKRETAEATLIAEAAVRAGVELTAEEVRHGFYGLSAVGWLHEREKAPPRTVLYLEDNVVAAILHGGSLAAAAARLLALVAPHEQAREQARAEANARFADLPADAPEWREWEVAWPTAHERFGAECDAVAGALGLAPLDEEREVR
jgi:hypothetical protein